jgi:hypothetical protein
MHCQEGAGGIKVIVALGGRNERVVQLQKHVAC